MAESVGLSLGDNVSDKLHTTHDLIDKEIKLNHEFALANLEVALPVDLDICSPVHFPALHSGAVASKQKVGNQIADQLPDPKSGIHINSWSVVRNRKSKNLSNDRINLEH